MWWQWLPESRESIGLHTPRPCTNWVCTQLGVLVFISDISHSKPRPYRVRNESKESTKKKKWKLLSSNQRDLCGYVCFGSYLVVLRHDSWLCVQVSLLVILREPCGVLRIEQIQNKSYAIYFRWHSWTFIYVNEKKVLD